MKFFSFVILLLAVFGCALAEDTCNVNGKVLKVGETYAPPGDCILVECTGPQQYFGKTCASVAVPPKCKLTPKDNSKPYPSCCPEVKCSK